MAEHRVVLSVDLDDWYHARWATGSPGARWPDAEAARREAAWPADGLRKPTQAILELFDRHGVTATFFVLGEVAEREPDLVREIAGAAMRSPATASITSMPICSGRSASVTSSPQEEDPRHARHSR